MKRREETRLNICLKKPLPAKFSIIPNLVENHHLLVANSLIASSALLSVLAGTAAGCIIFDSVEFSASMYFNGFTYLFSEGAIGN